MKAQTGVEFLTSYGWALLALIVFAVFIFYFVSTLQQPPPQCDFGLEFPCTSYQFFKKTDGKMSVVVKLTNGLGRDILLYNKKQVLTVENVGKSGVNNYTGVCVGPADIVKTGDLILCMFNITDKQVVPSIGKSTKFSVMLNYTNCGAGALTCVNGTNRTTYGKVVTNLELMPAGVASYCMDGKCDAGENYTNCGWDCPPPRPKYVSVNTQQTTCGEPFNITDPINVTVFVSSKSSPPYTPLPNYPVLIYVTGDPDYCPECASPSCLSYSTNPNPAITNATGYAFSQIQINWCSVSCSLVNYFTFINAVAGDVIGSDDFCFPVNGNCH